MFSLPSPKDPARAYPPSLVSIKAHGTSCLELKYKSIPQRFESISPMELIYTVLQQVPEETQQQEIQDTPKQQEISPESIIIENVLDAIFE